MQGKKQLAGRARVATRVGLASLPPVASCAASRVPTVPGLSRTAAAAALLSGHLRPDSPPPAPASRRPLTSRPTSAAASTRGCGSDPDEPDGSGGWGGGGGASAFGSRASRSTAFVPYYMRHEVEAYVSYGSYLQVWLEAAVAYGSRNWSAARASGCHSFCS
jgi:hypothetical protein